MLYMSGLVSDYIGILLSFEVSAGFQHLFSHLCVYFSCHKNDVPKGAPGLIWKWPTSYPSVLPQIGTIIPADLVSKQPNIIYFILPTLHPVNPVLASELPCKQPHPGLQLIPQTPTISPHLKVLPQFFFNHT